MNRLKAERPTRNRSGSREPSDERCQEGNSHKLRYAIAGIGVGRRLMFFTSRSPVQDVILGEQSLVTTEAVTIRRILANSTKDADSLAYLDSGNARSSSRRTIPVRSSLSIFTRLLAGQNQFNARTKFVEVETGDKSIETERACFIRDCGNPECVDSHGPPADVLDAEIAWDDPCARRKADTQRPRSGPEIRPGRTPTAWMRSAVGRRWGCWCL